MPEKKKQHFVPKFLLRNFSNNLDKKTIGIYNFENNKIIPVGNLKNQAYKDYFYGKTGEIEDALGLLEAEVSKIFQKMVNENYVPTYLSEDYITILEFTVFQAVRTEYSADAQEEIFNKMVKTIFRDDPSAKNSFGELFLKNENTPTFILGIVAKVFPIVLDLKCKLIVNTTTKPFIISDNPSVRYNQYLEKRNTHGSNTGFGTKGLQLFLPISSNFFLMFYDDTTYKVGNKKDSIILLNNERDINELNVLTFTGAYKNVYFNQDMSVEKLKELHEKAILFREEWKGDVTEYGSLDGRQNSLIHMFGRDIKVNLRLTFIKELKKAKKLQLGNSAVHIRNERLIKELKNV